MWRTKFRRSSLSCKSVVESTCEKAQSCQVWSWAWAFHWIKCIQCFYRGLCAVIYGPMFRFYSRFVFKTFSERPLNFSAALLQSKCIFGISNEGTSLLLMLTCSIFPWPKNDIWNRSIFPLRSRLSCSPCLERWHCRCGSQSAGSQAPLPRWRSAA